MRGKPGRGPAVVLHFDLDPIADAPRGVGSERLNGRRAQHGARTAIKRCTMQRADEAKTAKPPFAQSRIRMRADIIEGMPTLPGTAHDDLAPVDHDRAGLPYRKIGRIEHPPKFMFAHTAAISTPNLEPLVAFYRYCFGFEPVFEFSSPTLRAPQTWRESLYWALAVAFINIAPESKAE